MYGGRTPVVTALNTHFTPIAADVGKDFIPRLVDTRISPNTLAVLIAAITGEGGEVVADMLQIKANDNTAIIPNALATRTEIAREWHLFW